VQREQQQRHQAQQHRGGADRRAEELAQTGEHLARQGELLGPGNEQRHDQFVETGGEGEQRPGSHRGGDQRQHHAHQHHMERRAQAGGRPQQGAVEAL